ncbi:response regulator transcription factor [Sphingobacterium sp. Mn56C]|uniref:response regulator transcription factor n=1 Tax=Sphingobacterium sp. Mn56C TaxID=3395261 RepID=UPI003BC03D1C
MHIQPHTISLSIAESDYYFKEILVNSLLCNPFYRVLKNCNNGHELLSQLYFRQENIFIIDLFMPIMSGMEAISTIRKSGNSTPILTYSPTYQDDMCQYLSKFPDVYYCQKKSVVILDLLKNYILTHTQEYANYLKHWQLQPTAVHGYFQRQQKAWYTASVTEIQIMKLCYEGLSNKEIGLYLNLSSRSIDTYIANLVKKLGLRNKIDLIRFCVEQGYYNSST